MDYSKQLLTDEWRTKRFEILHRDKFNCRECGEKKNLHVHHKIYINGRMAWQYKNKDLITLCEKCHEKEHENKLISSFKVKNNKPKTVKKPTKYKIVKIVKYGVVTMVKRKVKQQ